MSLSGQFIVLIIFSLPVSFFWFFGVSDTCLTTSDKMSSFLTLFKKCDILKTTYMRKWCHSLLKWCLQGGKTGVKKLSDMLSSWLGVVVERTPASVLFVSKRKV